MSAPLRSWDIFMDAYWPKMAGGSDIAEIQRIARAGKWQMKWDLHQLVLLENKTVLITDTRQQILFASSNIFAMTGYRADEVVGSRPNMFQGGQTSAASRAAVKNAIQNLLPFSADLVNHRKDNSVYTCHIDGFPVFNEHNEHVNFIAFESAA